MTDLDIEIQNVVANGMLGMELDIEALNDAIGERAKISNSESEVTFKLTEDDPTVKVYRSGKYNILGAESVDQMHEYNNKVIKEFSSLGVFDMKMKVEFDGEIDDEILDQPTTKQGTVMEKIGDDTTVEIDNNDDVVIVYGLQPDDVETALENLQDEFSIEAIDHTLYANNDDTYFNICNIVASGSLGFDVNLNALAVGLGLSDVIYIPSQFSGLIYNSDDYPGRITLFSNGEAIFAGLKKEEQVDEAIEKFYEEVNEWV